MCFMPLLSVILTSGSTAEPPTPADNSLFFMENKGQWHPDARYLLRGGSTNYWITGDGIVLDHLSSRPTAALDRDGNPTIGQQPIGHAVRIRAIGSHGTGLTRGERRLEPKLSWMVGDTANWRNEIRTFASVLNEQLLPGVCARYYINGNAPRYDLIVAPGTNPESIELAYEGADNLRVNPDGSLQYETSVGTHRETGLFTYQTVNGKRKPVASRFVVNGNRVKFDLGNYDRNLPVVIDPQYLTYGTYLGGSNADEIQSVKVRANGDLLVGGYTRSTEFPVTAGSYDPSYNAGAADGFISIFRGNQLRFGTFIGTSTLTIVAENDLRVLDGDNITVSFDTNGAMPTTTAANNGTTINLQNNGYRTSNGAGIDAYIVKLRSDLGQIRYATYLGGNGGEVIVEGIVASPSGNIIVAGTTTTAGLPTTVTGAGANRAAVGTDGFVVALSTTLGSVRAGTYLGGTGADAITGLVQTESGRLYVGGRTGSSDAISRFGATGLDTTHGGANDGIVYYLNPNLTILRATFFGGSGEDNINRLALSGGRLFATGLTRSGTIWGTSPYPSLSSVGGFDQSYGGNQEGFVVALDDVLSAIRRFTYVGGTAASTVDRVDPIVAKDGRIFIAGRSDSTTGVRTGPSDTFLMVTGDAIPQLAGTQGYAAVLGTDLALLNATTFATNTTEPRDLALTGMYNDAVIVGSIQGASLPTSSSPNLAPYSSTFSGTRDGFIVQFAYTADPLELRLSSTTLASGQLRMFGNVWMNAPIAFGRTRAITSSDPRLEVETPFVTVAANARLSSQVRLRRAGTFATPTTVTISVLDGSGVVLSREVLVQP